MTESNFVNLLSVPLGQHPPNYGPVCYVGSLVSSGEMLNECVSQ